MTEASAPLPARRAVACAIFVAVFTAVALWIVADVESSGSRLSLSILGGLGGLLFGGLIALVLWDEAD